MDTDTLFDEGSTVADALHSVSTVDSRRLKETKVSDSFLGDGPRLSIKKLIYAEILQLCLNPNMKSLQI